MSSVLKVSNQYSKRRPFKNGMGVWEDIYSKLAPRIFPLAAVFFRAFPGKLETVYAGAAKSEREQPPSKTMMNKATALLNASVVFFYRNKHYS